MPFTPMFGRAWAGERSGGAARIFAPYQVNEALFAKGEAGGDFFASPAG